MVHVFNEKLSWFEVPLHEGIARVREARIEGIDPK